MCDSYLHLRQIFLSSKGRQNVHASQFRQRAKHGRSSMQREPCNSHQPKTSWLRCTSWSLVSLCALPPAGAPRHATSRALKPVQQTALSGFEATPLFDARCLVLPCWPARLCSLTARARSAVVPCLSLHNGRLV